MTVDKAARDAYYESLKVPVFDVYYNDRGICHLCGEFVHPTEASRDHVRPRSKGGKTTWDNLKLAHKSCNSQRRT